MKKKLLYECDTNLYHMKKESELCFRKGGVYKAVSVTDEKIILIDAQGERHHITAGNETEAGWMKHFTEVKTATA